MDDEILPALEGFLTTGNLAGALDFLVAHFEQSGHLGPLFEAKVMQQRLKLGLSLLQSDSPNIDKETRTALDNATIQAAREVGEAGLRRGDIAGAWPYFRAIGERATVVSAIDAVPDDQGTDRLIEIAFQESVNPAKGLAFILAQHGMCRAITAFGMYPVQNGRADCISLLVRNLHAEVLERVAATVESQEGQRPQASNLSEIFKDRDWLFGDYVTYVDTSHVLSVLPWSLEMKDRETLGLMAELCDYGRRLASMFHQRGQPPFDDPFVDYGHYIETRLGLNVDEHLAHFRHKLGECDPDLVGSIYAELLVNMLSDLGRYNEAIEIYREHIPSDAEDLTCPSLLRLYHIAGDVQGMRSFARETNDVLGYVAACSLALTP